MKMAHRPKGITVGAVIKYISNELTESRIIMPYTALYSSAFPAKSAEREGQVGLEKPTD